MRKIEQFTGQRLEASVIAGYEPKRPAPRTDGPGRGASSKGRPGFKQRTQGNGGGYRGNDRSANGNSNGQPRNARRSRNFA